MTAPNRANHPARRIGGFVGSLAENVSQRLASAKDTRTKLNWIKGSAQGVPFSRGLQNSLPDKPGTPFPAPEESQRRVVTQLSTDLQNKGVSPKRIARAVNKANKPLSPNKQGKLYQKGVESARQSGFPVEKIQADKALRGRLQ